MNRSKILFNVLIRLAVFLIINDINASYYDLNSPSKFRTLCCAVIAKNPNLIKQANIKLPDELKQRIAARYATLNIKDFVQKEKDESDATRAMIREKLPYQEPATHPFIEKLDNEHRIKKGFVEEIMVNPANTNEIAFRVTFNNHIYVYNKATDELKKIVFENNSSILYLPHYPNVLAVVQAILPSNKLSFIETTTGKLIKSINNLQGTKLCTIPLPHSHKSHASILFTPQNLYQSFFIYNFRRNETIPLCKILSGSAFYPLQCNDKFYIASFVTAYKILLQQPTLEEIIAKGS